MISLFLTIHVIALTVSIFATTGMMILALLSHRTPVLARKANLFITSLGIVIGTVLLIQQPLGSRCLELISYVVIFAFAYKFIAARSAQLASTPSVAASR